MGLVLGQEVALVHAPLARGQRALEEVADVERGMSPTHDLPVEEADLAVREHVGIADVRVPVDEGERGVRNGPDELHPVVVRDRLTEPAHWPGDAIAEPIEGHRDAAAEARPYLIGGEPVEVGCACAALAPEARVKACECAQAARGLVDAERTGRVTRVGAARDDVLEDEKEIHRGLVDQRGVARRVI